MQPKLPGSIHTQAIPKLGTVGPHETVDSYDTLTELGSLFISVFQKRMEPLALVGKSSLFALLLFSTVVLGHNS